MRNDVKIVAILLTLNTVAVNGTVYKLFINNCEGEKTSNLIAHLVIAIVVSFGLAFLMQKLGMKFRMKSKADQNEKS